MLQQNLGGGQGDINFFKTFKVQESKMSNLGAGKQRQDDGLYQAVLVGGKGQSVAKGK